jgi:glycosyltransferase involved in cell wall biosynthesis
MATYNGATYLEEQLQSIFLQEVLPEELCVTDDGSTDATLTILEAFAVRAPFQMQIHKNPQRLGYGRNFLKAASLCKAEYVAFCDQDDVWRKDKFKKVHATILEKSPDFIVHSGVVVDQSLVPTGDRYPDIQCAGWLEPAQLPRDFFWPGYALVMKRVKLLSWGMDRVIDDEKRGINTFAHDRWVFDSARESAACYQLPDELVQYRQHSANHIGFRGMQKTMSE